MANNKQALSAIAGAAIGFIVGGGPLGAFYGFQYGLLAGALLFPADLPGIEGPRLEDFETAEADPGAPVFKVFGASPVPGFRMYLGPVSKTDTVTSQGGKGGGGEQSTTTHTYFQTVVLGLAEGPQGRIVRIWENGAIVYDARPQQEGESDDDYTERYQASNTYELGDLSGGGGFTLYLGTEDQLADPTLETELGVGAVPAFRGLCYMVFPDRELLEDQARRHPAWKIELNGVSEEELVAISGGTSSKLSIDGGITWEDGGVVPTPNSGSAYAKVRFSPELNQLLLTGTTLLSVPLVISNDRGVSWTALGGSDPKGPDAAWCSGFNGGAGYWILTRYSNNTSFSPTGESGSWTQVTGAGGSRVLKYLAYSDAQNRLVGVGVSDGFGFSGGLSYTDGPSGVSGGWVLVSTNNFLGVEWIPELGKWFAARDNGDIWMSTDGANWSVLGNVAAFTNQVSFAYSPKLELLVLSTSTTVGIWSSDDEGASWTQRRSAVSGDAIIWSTRGEKFYSIRSAISTILVSSDGISWSTQALSPSPRWATTMYPSASGPIRLAKIIRAICADVGITDIDVSELEGTYVLGYAVARHMNARSALDPLRMVGQFDYVETGTTLKFKRRGGASVATLTDSDIGAKLGGRNEENEPAITTTKLQDVDLPRQIRVRYLSYAREYEKSEQLSPSRVGTAGVNDVTVDVPVVMDDDEAAKLADILMRDAWASRWQHEFSVDQRWTALEPADVIMVPVDGRSYRMRILTITDKALVERRISAVRDDDGAYTSLAVNSDPAIPSSTLKALADTSAYLLNLPSLIEENDAGFLASFYPDGGGSRWDGAILHRSIDGGSNYSQMLTATAEGIVGTIVSAPTSGLRYGWNRSDTIVVDMENSKSLAGASVSSVLGGANTAAIGAPGRWQIVQWRDAELVSTDRYSLSMLLLGRRGTEHNLPDIMAGDAFVLLSSPAGLYDVPLQATRISNSYLYRSVSIGKAFSSASDVSFAGTGERLKPFSPVRVRGSRAGDDLTITWMRRDRLSECLQSGVSVPLSEDSEAYEVEILDTGVVVRTITGLSSPTASYSGAEQTTDFGSPQSAIDVRIYQLSAQVGRGTPAEATL